VTIATVTADQKISATWGNSVAAAINGASRIGRYTASAFGVPTASTTNIDLSVDYDPNSWFASGATVTPTVAGYYLVSGAFTFTGGFAATDRLACFIRKNGTQFVGVEGYAGYSAPRRNLAHVVYLAGTDTVSLAVYQASGASRTVDASLAVVQITFG